MCVLATYTELLDVYPLLWVFLQQSQEEVLKLLVALAVKLNRIHPYGLVQFDHAMLLKRYSAEKQAIQCASHRPYVSGTSRDVAVLGNTQFWRHECWRPSRFRRLHLAIFVEHF